MKKKMGVSLCLFLSALCLQARQTDRRPMTTDDMLNLVQVGDVMISPDGNRVFFSRSSFNWGKNKRESKYYMIPSSGGKELQYIGEAGGSRFRFSPDGKYLAFQRTVDKKTRYFLCPAAAARLLS